MSLVVRLSLALVFISLSVSGCAKKKLSGKRIDLSGFESAQRSKVVDNSERNIRLPNARATSNWQQELFSTLHTAPHLDITPSWKRRYALNTGAKRTKSKPLQATPIVAGSRLFSLSAKGVVSAFDVETGKTEWRQDLKLKKEKGFGGGLGLESASGKLIVTTGSGNVFALDATDGEILWNYAYAFPLRSAPTVSDKHILAITPNHRALALSLDGVVQWQHQSPNQTSAQLALAPAAAIIGRYAIIGYGDGSLFALDISNGQPLWKANISTRRNDALADILDISAPVVVSGGVVYASSYSGKTVALDLASGAVLWRISLATTSWLALFENHLFVVDSNSIMSALDIKNGKVVWERQLTAYANAKKKSKPIFWNGPLLADGKLIVSGSNGEVITLNALDGAMESRQKFRSKFTGNPIAAGELIFLLDSKGMVHAFE